MLDARRDPLHVLDDEELSIGEADRMPGATAERCGQRSPITIETSGILQAIVSGGEASTMAPRRKA